MSATIRSRPPSGEQIELANADWQLTVAEVGGGMRLLRHRDWPVLDGYPIERMCNGGRGQPLIPWPNRIDGGRYVFDGQPQQLPLTEPLEGNAIHGLVRWSHWRATEREQARVVMEHTLDPQPGYPFALALRLEYILSKDGLRITTSLTNIGSTRIFRAATRASTSRACGSRQVNGWIRTSAESRQAAGRSKVAPSIFAGRSR